MSDETRAQTSAPTGAPEQHTVAQPPGAAARAALDSDLDARPGSAVPGYEIIGELGRGGMGVVFKARHLKLDRLVALKMMLPDARAGAVELSRFRAEGRALARLQHAHIVQVFEADEWRGCPFIALELLDTGSLAGKLDGTPWPDRAAAELVEKLAGAVQHAHEQSIIHRDLKPANVLLLPDGSPKIADFGLAKWVDADAGQTQPGAIMGTPSYMAPEQAKGQPVGPATDVYALGVVLYELVTGRVPFKGTTVLETLEQVCEQTPVPPRQVQPKLSRDLETICLKCLEKSPADRYASARELADDLRRLLAGEPVHARPLGLLTLARRALAFNRLDSSFRPWAAFAVLLGGVVMTGCLAEVIARHYDSARWVQIAISRTTITLTAALLVFRCFGLRSNLERQLIVVICGCFVGKYFVYWMVFGAPVPPLGTNTLPVAMMTYALAFFFLGTTHSGLFYILCGAHLGAGLAMFYLSWDQALIVHGLAWGATGAAVGRYLWHLGRDESPLTKGPKLSPPPDRTI